MHILSTLTEGSTNAVKRYVNIFQNNIIKYYLNSMSYMYCPPVKPSGRGDKAQKSYNKDKTEHVWTFHFVTEQEHLNAVLLWSLLKLISG